MKKRKITAEDLYNFKLLSDCQLSPDGKHVLFCVQRVDRKTEKKYSNIWIAPVSGGSPRQFTYGDHVDYHPAWSPNGKTIAFLSNRGSESQFQIYLIPSDGGEAKPLTSVKGSFGGFSWSPDGKKFVSMFRKTDRETIELEKDEQKKKLGIVARHITRTFYKMDGAGFLPKERWHIWTISALNGKAVQLTDGEIHDEHSPVWSPDGKTILFVSNSSKDPDMNPDMTDLFTIPSSGGKAKKLKAPEGPKGDASYSPDGKWIAFVGKEGTGEWWKNKHIYILSPNSKTIRCLTEKSDLDVSGWTIGDLGEAAVIPPQWAPDGSAIFFQTARHGITKLCEVSTGTAKIRDIIASEGVVGSYCIDGTGHKAAFLHAEMDSPGEIKLHNIKTGKTNVLTSVNKKLMNALDLGKIEEVWFKGAGNNDLQGWILTPPGFDPKKKYPSILEIHGGPRVQYGHAMMHEFRYLAANGFVVYFCNPRGSQGYGEKHSKAIWNNWGTVDYDDLMKWADIISKKPYIDKNRMGVTGGSYGGYMTNWIIGHTDRFRAAVTQRSVSNLISMYGSSDFNWVFQQEFGDTPPWENTENYLRQSPITFIGNAKTPTLVLHNEKDYRCAYEQGEQVYISLKKLGVDTEFVLFPDEPHGLSRVGRTDRRIARLNHILRWFNKYLK